MNIHVKPDDLRKAVVDSLANPSEDIARHVLAMAGANPNAIEKSITTGTGLVAYDLQAPAKNLSLAAAATALGAHRQRTDGLAAEVKALAERVTAMETLKVAVEGLSRGIEHLGERLADSHKLSASEMGRLADQLAAGQKLMDARFEALRDLSARELGELKQGLRSLHQALEPPAPPARRRGGADAAGGQG